MNEVSYVNRIDVSLKQAALMRRQIQNENLDSRIQGQTERQ